VTGEVTELSGNIPVNGVYYATTNTMTVLFTTDAQTTSSGFHFGWFLDDKPSTTLPSAGSADQQVDVTQAAAGMSFHSVIFLLFP